MPQLSSVSQEVIFLVSGGTMLSGVSWSCCDVGICWLGESISNALHGSHNLLQVSKYLCIGLSHQVIILILLGFQLIKCGIDVGGPDSMEWLDDWGCVG